MSLADCFKKAGKALSASDKESIEAMIEAGMSEIDAVQSVAAQIDSEIESVYNEVEKQGGQISKPKAMTQDKRRPRGYFSAATNTITFTKNSDLSTFIHESAHFFLETYRDLAEKSPEIKSDLLAIDKWAAAHGKTSDRDVHELFASTFEAYAREGKAPSTDLKAVFSKFRQWLVFTYKNLKDVFARGGMNTPEIPQEITDVMDRMLASQQEIDAARMEMYGKDLPIDEIAPSRSREYRQAAQDAADEAETTLTSRALKDYKKQREKWWKDEKKELWIPQVESELAGKKEYKARFGIAESAPEAKLSAEFIKENYSEAERKKLQHLSSKVGAHPDAIAALYEYESGDEMIQALLGTMNDAQRKKYVDAEAQKRMIDEYGDVINDPELEEAAKDAVHGEMQGKKIALELKILNEKIGPEFARQGIVQTDKNTYRMAAEKYISSLPISQVKPHIHLRNEQKLSREALMHATKGNWLEARNSKHRQLRQFYIYKAARDAVQLADKHRARLQKISTTNYDKSRVHPDYIQSVKTLIAAYDMRKSPDLSEIQLNKVNKFISTQIASNPSLAADEYLSKITSWKDMTIGDLQALRDAAENILKVGRDNSDLEKKMFRDTMDSINDSIKNNATRDKPSKRERSFYDKAKSFAKGYLAEHRTIHSLALELDGNKWGGVVNEKIYLKIKRADDKYIDRGMKASKELNEILSAYTTKEKLKFFNRTFVPEMGESLSLNARLSFALNMGNEGNVAAMKNEYSDEQINGVLKTLTDKDWDVVEAIWRHIDQYWPEISALEARVGGISPAKVEAVPFIAPGGRKVRGGYYPLVADPLRSGAGKKDFEDAQTLNGFLEKGRAKASTKHGSTYDRVGFGQDRFVWLDLGVAFSHVDGVIKDIEMREAVLEVSKIISDKGFREQIIRAKGEEFHSIFEEWLKSTVGSLQQPLTMWDKVAHWLRAGVSIAEMGLSPRTMLQQPFGITQTNAIIGEKYTAIGVGQFMMERSKAVQKVMDLSPFMKNRAATFNRDVRDAQKILGVKSLHDKTVDFAFKGIQLLDMSVAIPSWIGGYEKAKADGLTGQEAVDYADSVVSRGQGTGLPRDLSTIQNRRGIIRVLTMFYSFFNSYWNLQVNLLKGTNFKNPAQAARYGLNQVWVTIIPALLVDYLFNGGPDDDEEWAEWALQTQGAYLAGGLVGFRDIVNSVATGFDYQVSPAANAIATPLKLAKQVEQGEMDGAAWKAGVMTAGYLLHIPGARTAARFGDYVLTEGADDLDTFEGIWGATVTGPER